MSTLRPPRISVDLYDRYLRGQCTLDEQEQVRAVIAADPALGAFHHGMRTDTATVDRMWERFVHEQQPRAAAPSQVAPRGSMRSRERSRTWPIQSAWGAGIGLAAMGIAMAALAFVFGGAPFSRSAAPTTRTYATAAGQQMTVTLQDGATVVLASASRLVVETSPLAGSVATLTGEAVFSVSHRTHRAFSVRSGRALVQVLGTSFAVRHYPADRGARVVVTEGRVSVRDRQGAADRYAVLDASMLAMVDDSGAIRVTSPVMADEYTGWAHGELVFREATVADVVAQLRQHYSADIRLADSTLARRKLTWTVRIADRSLDGLLDALGVVLDAHYTRAGGVVTLAPGRPADRSTLPSKPISETQYGK